MVRAGDLGAGIMQPDLTRVPPACADLTQELPGGPLVTLLIWNARRPNWPGQSIASGSAGSRAYLFPQNPESAERAYRIHGTSELSYTSIDGERTDARPGVT